MSSFHLITLDDNPADFEEAQFTIIGCPCKVSDFILAVHKLAKEFREKEATPEPKKPCGCK